ncbi:MAG: DUF1638 domain-containing protein [Pseudomonadota bacterium]
MDNLISEKTRLIACGMLAREVLDLIALNDWHHIDLKCLPAELHYYPERIPAAVETAVNEARTEGFDNIVIGYADCGTGGLLDATCERLDVERLDGPHCFALYWGLNDFAKDEEENITTFFITDFLARHPETFFLKPLGLDRHPELTQIYFANYTRALYLAQTESEELTQSAKRIADMLGLAFERKKTGYGDLGHEIATLSPARRSV